MPLLLVEQFGKILRIRKNTAAEFGKILWKNTPENPEKYSPKNLFPEAKSLFTTTYAYKMNQIQMINWILTMNTITSAYESASVD